MPNQHTIAKHTYHGNCIDCNEPKSTSKAVRCVQCARDYRYGKERPDRSRSKADSITQYIAVEQPCIIRADTVVRCYYCPCTKMNVLAPSRKRAIEGIEQTGRSFQKDLVTDTVCFMSHININMTSIDLSQYTQRRTG
jgi:hypothetical protein